MALPTDRVQIQKRESAAGGGDAADDSPFLYEPLDSSEDCVELHGLFFQDDSGIKDELVAVWRAGDDLTFYDVTTGVETTLSGLSTHSALSGLGADDHTQYVLADGTRNITGTIAINTATHTTTSIVQIEGSGATSNVPALYLNNCGAGNGGINIKNGSGVVQLFGTSGQYWNTYSPNRTMRFNVTNDAYDASPQAFMFNQGSSTPERHVMVIEAAADVTTGNNLMLRNDYVGTGEHVAISLINETAATVGAQKYSPMLVFEGHGWKTDATAASQSVRFGQQLETIQGTVSPSGDLVFKSSINGGAYSDVLRIQDDGNIIPSSITLGGNVGSDILISSDGVSTSNLALVTAGYLDALYAESGDLVTDHGALTGLADDDHTQYLRVDGTRASTGAQTFSAGIVIGGITGSDILISSDGASASNTALVTAGYVDAHAGGGTLDTAYDFGGAGSGRAITADSGAVTLTTDAVGVAETTALELINSTAAANGAQQFSPSLSLKGQGWASFFSTSMEINFTQQVETIQNAVAQGDLVWRSSVDGGASAERLRLTSAGHLSLAGSVTAGSISINGQVGGDILISSDGVSTSNSALVTAGYVDAHYAATGDIVTDHGALTGLADDDHTQYLLVNGTRAMTGGLNMGTNAITGATTIAASSNVTVGGTLGVTGITTLAALNATTGSFSDDVAVTGILDANGGMSSTTGTFTSTLGVTGLATFSAGLSMGGNTVSDILISSDSASTSNTALVTAGYVDAHAGGGTLDTAYDFGGAGVGRLITVDNGPLELTNNSVGTGTTTPAMLLVNNTSATNGVQKYSPLLELEGQGYSTGFVASQEVKFAIQTRPIQQTLNPTGKLSFLESVNGDAYNEIATLDTIGSLDLGGNLSAGGGVFSGTLTAQNTSNFTGVATFNGDVVMNGDDRHGDRTAIFAAGGGLWMSTTGTWYDGLESSAASDWAGRAIATGIGNILAIPITLRVGDRIKSMVFRYYGASTATKRFSFIYCSTASSTPVVHYTTTSTLSSYRSFTANIVDYSVVTGRVIWAQMRTGAANDRFYCVDVTYDRP